MKDFHPPILALLKHYAVALGEVTVQQILVRGDIANEAEAKALLAFLDAMHRQAIEDERAGRTVLGQRAYAGDAEKAYLLVEDFVTERGYGHLIRDMGD